MMIKTIYRGRSSLVVDKKFPVTTAAGNMERGREILWLKSVRAFFN